MKQIIIRCLILFAGLSSVSQLPAQTFKWEYVPPNEVMNYNGDGFGGLAVNEVRPGEKGFCVWIASNGQPQFTNQFEFAPEYGRRCDIVRLTRNELAIFFLTRQSPEGPIVNVLRRFKKTKKGITVSETVLNGNVPLIMPQMSDPFGFFTTGTYFTEERRQYFAIRRYSN